ncbi:MAG: SH3 domain-containing protein, partial [Candidatus Riflebacteria bacterium]|nr:SH3 domain-containing protein [Candidatus Riflebacteria bacterium]
MKKTSFLFAVLFCFLGFAVLLGNDGSSFDDSLGAVEIGNTSTSSSSDSSTVKSDEKASEESKTKTEEAKEEKKEEEKKGMATLPDGIAYVGVYSYLNLRSSIWGAVIGELYNNEEVTITGRDGDWYLVSTSKGDGYAHARYIFATKDARYQGNDVT